MHKFIRDTYERLRFVHRGWRYRLRTEAAEVAYMLRHYHPTMTGIDIGAHKGAFTYWMMRKAHNGARIIAFEPLPELAQLLRRLHTLHRADLRVEQLGLSDASGCRTLFRPRRAFLGMTSFTRGDHPHGYDELTVETTTLDQYFDEHGGRPVGFIKCDVEGHELAVLRGGMRMLAEDQPAMLLECEDHRNGGGQLQRVTGFLDHLGYRCFALFSSGICPLDRCAADMEKLRVGVDSYRNFAFLPRGQIDALTSSRTILAHPPKAA